MKKPSVSKLFVVIALFTGLFFHHPNQAQAASCVNWDVSFDGSEPPSSINVGELESYEVKVKAPTFSDGDRYELLFWNRGGGGPIKLGEDTAQDSRLQYTVTDPSVISETGPKTLQLHNVSTGDTCELWDYDVTLELTCGDITFTQAGVENTSCIDNKSGPIKITVSGISFEGQPYEGSLYLNVYTGVQPLPGSGPTPISGGVGSMEIDPTGLNDSRGYRFTVYKDLTSLTTICSKPMNILDAACADDQRIPTDDDGEETVFELCTQITDETLAGKCRECAGSGEAGADGQGGVWTAVGCISRDPVGISTRLIQVGLGMGGGVALIMTLAGGFILSTSQGDPQKANQAREMITNSVIGLLFVIFSVVILQFIGVTILKIPGFGSSP